MRETVGAREAWGRLGGGGVLGAAMGDEGVGRYEGWWARDGWWDEVPREDYIPTPWLSDGMTGTWMSVVRWRGGPSCFIMVRTA